MAPTDWLNILDFGAVPDGVTDCTAAIQAALDAAGPAATSAGGTVYAPRGKFFCSGILHIRRGLDFRGASGAIWFSGTTLLFGPEGNVHADPPPSGSAANRGDWFALQNMVIQQQSHGSTPIPGILVQTPCRLRDLYVTGWSGHGVWIDGNTGNANLWEITNCLVDTCQGDGLHVEGGNCNAGRADLLSCIGNQGYGIFDQSFLGNAYYSPHMRGNVRGAYWMTGIKPVGSALFNPYSESDQPPSQLGKAVAFGPGVWGQTPVGGTLIPPL